jgi:dipeptidyl aminopeptidase/acylaminoacyl peptidase
MDKLLRIVVIACVSLVAFSKAVVALPPVEAFGQLPDITSAELSPDGKHFAAIQAIEGKPVVAIYEVGAAPGTRPVVLPSEGWLIRDIKWVKNDRLVAILTESKKLYWTGSKMHTWARAVSVGADGSNVVVLLGHNPSLNVNLGIGRIADRDIADPDSIYMPLWIFSDMRTPEDEARSTFGVDDANDDVFTYDLYRVNARTGEGTRVAGGGHYTNEWYLDGQGKIVARLDETKQPLVDHLLLYRDGDWHEAGTFDAEADKGADVAGLSADGTALVRYARGKNSLRNLTEMDISSGKEKVVYSAPGYDVSDTIVDEWTDRIVGVSYEADTRKDFYFDPKREALQRGLEQAFPGLTVGARSLDAAQDKVIVVTDGPRTPPSYYFLDRTTHQATPIASAYPKLAEADLGEMKPYAYKARDGLDIPAYLTLPPGRAPKNLPAVVMPHGGPDARDEMSFDWWAQFMANRGYAVLQPNYRGSSGYGHKFTEAGLHQWGLKMQDDISDGVAKMVADGIADPKRVCIVGASYGGYAALAGAAFSPSLYACAVSVAGVSDLPAMIHEERGRYGKHSSELSFWISRIGSLDDDSEQLRATSPARHADKVTCPVLLMHGDGDTTVPISQSELMYEALQGAGKNVSFVKLEGDDHYLALAASRIRILSEIESFLATNIGSATAAKR